MGTGALIGVVFILLVGAVVIRELLRFGRGDPEARRGQGAGSEIRRGGR